MQGVLLEDLVRALPECSVKGDAVVPITGFTYDSRTQMPPGTLFAAFEGAHHDGHEYVSQAVAKGAAALLVSRDLLCEQPVPVVKVPDCRRALAIIARELYHNPGRRLVTAGVTGTKGKTTTTYLLKHILEQAGKHAGLIGTIGYCTGSVPRPAPNTTPEAADLQVLFHEMVENHLTHAIMEVSSHALALGRTELVEFDAAAFTNLGHDHMDFHTSVHDYASAKSTLFASLSPLRWAVINGDDPYGAVMAEAARKAGAPVMGVSASAKPPDFACDMTILAHDVKLGRHGASFLIVNESTGEPVLVETALMGAFNVANCLTAMGLALCLGVGLETSARTLASFAGVPGRFQAVRCGQDFAVIVDYAHNPDSLANVLSTAKSICDGRLISVFGCGGDRDRTKRPIMGRISCELADFTIVTSDNPRSERPEAIAEEVTEGIGAYNGRCTVVLDRRDAIRQAVKMACSGDVIVIAGKGHETYQIFDGKTVHFDDVEEARIAIGELMQSV